MQPPGIIVAIDILEQRSPELSKCPVAVNSVIFLIQGNCRQIGYIHNFMTSMTSTTIINSDKIKWLASFDFQDTSRLKLSLRLTLLSVN